MSDISDAKLAANRANAQKSTGPRTEEGKAASSRNALKHGVYSRTNILEGESQDAFNQLKQDYFARLQPQDDLEIQLIFNMVMLEWQIRRYRIADTTILHEATLDPALGGPGFSGTGCFAVARAIEEIAARPVANFIMRKLMRMSRELTQMLRNFLTLRKSIPPAPAAAPTPQPDQRQEQAEQKAVKNEPTSYVEKAKAFTWESMKPKVLTAAYS